MEEFRVDDIPVSVIRKPIKNAYIRILPPDGSVRVTAPFVVSNEWIGAFVLSRRPWIKKQQNRLREQMSAKREAAYISGEDCSLWGLRYELLVQETKAKPQAVLSGDKIVLQVRKESTKTDREAVLNEWYREQLKKAIPGILLRCEEKTGVQAKEWHVKNMRTRWGSCNIGKKRIWLNLQLAKKPPECLAYVITHELVHLLEKNHNRRFYAYMDLFYPGWREVKKLLNN